MECDFLNKIIFGKFQIIKLIGRGAYSRVFSVRNLANQKIFAMKVQNKSDLYGNLETEAYNLYRLKGLGIPKIVSYGHYRKYNVLVMELLGKSLDKLFIENINIGEKLRKKDAILAGLQMLDRIEHIHSKNLLHLDIKPENFLVGEPDSSLIYIIDFGFSKQYRSFRTGKHIQYGKKNFFNGNLIFSSAKTMCGIEPSRRDDLESLGYVLINLFSKELPWKNIAYKNKKEYAQKAYRLKKTIPLETLCKDAPKEMIDFMKYVKSLKFEEEPKYNYLKNLLGNMIKKYNALQFSWVNKSLIKLGRNSAINNIKKKRVSPFSKIFSKLSSKSCIPEKVNNIQIINGLQFKTVEKESNYERLNTNTEKSENLNYINNIKSKNNVDVPNQLYNYNEKNLKNQDLFMKKRLELSHKNKSTINHLALNQINYINHIKNLNNKNTNNFIKFNTYENKGLFNNDEIYSTIGINSNTILNEQINYDPKINYKNNKNLVKSKTNNKYFATPTILKYSDKKMNPSQKKYKNYNTYNSVIGAQTLISSQTLKSKNNYKKYLNNFVNGGQGNTFQSRNNDALYKNIVYTPKFEK